MRSIQLLGKIIKSKRLSLNMTMDDVAKQANITRATLWSIEKGNGNCSVNTLFNVLNVLGLSFDLDNEEPKTKRNRATRTNTKLDKKKNRFVVMCVEQYSAYKNKPSDYIYKIMLKNKVINELQDDYEDLHGMSNIYLNEYIDALLTRRKR